MTTFYGVFGMFQYVIGTAHHLEVFSSEALFVVVTRFLVAFGLSWFPITEVIATISYLITLSRK